MSDHKHSAIRQDYPPGHPVRVRRGVTDPDFPDLTIGGWAGTVVQVDTSSSPPIYLVRWSRETLRAVHPVHRKRAERDGFEIGEMWLGAEDLEADDGTGTGVEQPTNIITKPLSLTNQEDRIRVVFGLTSDDPLPVVGVETLRAFYEYLSHHLRFPIEASWNAPDGPAQRVTVIGLSAPDADLWADGMCGLLCRAKLKGAAIEVALADCEAKGESSSRQLLADYGYWFGNFG